MDIRGYKEEDLQEIKKLIAKIYKTDKGSLDYYMSNTIKNKINVIVAEENKKISIPDHFIIRSISEIESYEDKYKVINLYKQIYIRNHTFNKVSSLNDDQWKDIIFKDLYAEGSFMILDNNKIIALSLIYYGEDKGILELGLRGT